MSDYVTKEELPLHLENTALKITKAITEVLDAKFEEQTSRMDKANIENRDRLVFEVTGFPMTDASKIRDSVQYAHREFRDSADTKKKVKGAAIGFGVPFGLGGAIAWFTQHFNLGP